MNQNYTGSVNDTAAIKRNNLWTASPSLQPWLCADTRWACFRPSDWRCLADGTIAAR